MRVQVNYLCAPRSYNVASFQAVQSLANTNVYVSPGYTYAGTQYIQRKRTRVEIDLNVRVRGNDTFVGFGDVSGPIAIGESVEVFESESGVSGEGRVTEIDGDRELVYLSVDWSSLKEDDSSSCEETPASDSTQLLFIGTSSATTTSTTAMTNTFSQQSWIELVPRPCLADISGNNAAIWITAPLYEPYSLLVPGQFSEPYIELRQNVVFGNSLVVAA
jgi:hypothetical protein